jgi:hypothetical protein
VRRLRKAKGTLTDTKQLLQLPPPRRLPPQNPPISSQLRRKAPLGTLSPSSWELVAVRLRRVPQKQIRVGLVSGELPQRQVPRRAPKCPLLCPLRSLRPIFLKNLPDRCRNLLERRAENGVANQASGRRQRNPWHQLLQREDRVDLRRMSNRLQAARAAANLVGTR